MKNILFVNKYLLAAIPFSIPVIFILYIVISNLLINIFPIKPFIIQPKEISIKYWWEEYILTPVKKFWIDWKLISTKDYSDIIEKEEKIISKDWLFVFWKVAEDKYLKNLEFTQIDRSFVYDYLNVIDLNRNYINTHTTNLNILTNNNKISKKLKDLSNWTELKIFWYLVNIELINSDSYFKQNTSTTLNDSWYWSSEILFVTRLEINWKVID